MDSRLKMSGMTEREAGGTVWGKARGFPIKDIGNDRGAIDNVGHDRGAIDNGGHDRRGRKTSGMTEGD